MFEFAFTKKDLVRSAYAFVFAVAAYLVVVQPTDAASLKTAVVGALAAGVAAVKNLFLKDGTTAKG